MIVLADIFLLLPGYLMFLSGILMITLSVILVAPDFQTHEKTSGSWLATGIFFYGLSRVLIAFNALLPESIFFIFETLGRILTIFSLGEFFRRTRYSKPAIPRALFHAFLATLLLSAFIFSESRFSLPVILIFLVIKSAALYAGVSSSTSLEPGIRQAIRISSVLAIIAIFCQTFTSLMAGGWLQIPTQTIESLAKILLGSDCLVTLGICLTILTARYYKNKSDSAIAQTPFSLFSPFMITLAIVLFTFFGMHLSHSVARQQYKQSITALEKSLQGLTKMVEQRFSFASTSAAIISSVPAISDILTASSPEVITRLDRFFKSFTENSPGAICYLLDKNGIVKASSTLHHLFIGKNLAFRQYFIDSLQGKRGMQIDNGVLTGTPGFFASYPIRDAANEIVGVCAVKKNLDDLGNALRLNHPAMLLESSGTIILGSSQNIIGKSFSPLSGIATGTASLRTLQHPDFPELTDKHYLYAFENLQAVDAGLIILRETEAGIQQLWVLIVVLLIVIVFVAIMNGIDRNNESMKLIAKAQKHFKTLFENAPESIFVVSLVTLKVIEANQSMLRQFQFATTADGVNYFDLMPPGDRNITNAWHSASKKMFKHERNFRKQNGEIFAAEVTGAIMEFNNDPTLLIILHDISMHRKIESKLIEARNAAEEANAMKIRFFANASHEVRTPMTAIIGLSEMAADKCNDANVKHFIELVRISSKSMLSLLNDIFDLAQLETGKLNINPVQFNLHLLLEDLIEIVKFQSGSSPRKVTLHLDSNLPEMIIADPDRLRQILLNILGIAAQIARHSEIILRATMQNPGTRESCVEFTVSSSDNDDLSRILNNLFDSFVFNQPYLRNEIHKENHLGLSISKQLIDLMDGKILTIKDNHITTAIKIVIPASTRAVAAAILPESKPAIFDIELCKNGKPLHFLIADDNEINLFLAQSIIQKFKGMSTCVTDGIETVDAMRSSIFDAILLDIQMPRLDGLAALKEIRKMPEPAASIPVIAVSAFASEQERTLAREAGANSYLSKPYFPEELLTAIKELLELDSPATASTNEKTLSKTTQAEKKDSRKSLKQINRHELEMRILQKPENILQINSIYLRRSQILAADLDKYAADNDCPHLRETAHSIKGLAGMLAANVAFELARDLENLSRDGKLNEACSHIADLKRILQEISEDLAVLTSEINKN